MARSKATSSKTYFDKLEDEIKSNNSPLSLILGALIILVVGILIFNFFNQKGAENIGTGEKVEQGDVSPGKLPGKYTVKEDDTLFMIAEKYYQDGYKFSEIAKENKLSDVNALEVGQVLDIPKLAEAVMPEASTAPAATSDQGTGGGDTTIWGPKIEGQSYTVVEGDWLSTIAARAYNDIMAYTKIASANSITNPDLIYPGQVLKLPR